MKGIKLLLKVIKAIIISQVSFAKRTILYASRPYFKVLWIR